jgi:Protein of unknown function (DUF1553)/Protein of unknown function (DUF1549)/Planctomycete cytochrome C
MSYRRVWLNILVASLAHSVLMSAADDATRREFFETKIRPVLAQQCLSCHSGDRPQAGLNLDYRGGWEVGGKSGPAIVPGDPDKSLIVRALRHEQGVTPMPLGGRAPAETIAAFEEWIRTGAFDPREKSTVASPVSKSWEETFNERREWWSLQPVSRPPVPSVKQKQWSREPLDQFILAKMEAAGLTPARPADRSTLLRRLSFVLTGLPPTPEELDRFLADRDPKAYEKLVSRLLGSPHFGEHWARHWMDVVSYSDTYGYESDIPAKGAWRYRDYLIRAFNQDVSFDQLAREQIAGDLLVNPRINLDSQINESLIGTMFYQMGEKREGDSLQFNGIHQEMINNKIDVFSKAFQAMTVGCARCHDHKLDAVSQRDYYAMAGVFMSSRWVANTLDSPERNRITLQRLAALKPKIREVVAQWWLESVSDVPKRLEALLPEKDEPEKGKSETDKPETDKPKEKKERKKLAMEDPLYIWFELKAAQTKSQTVQETWHRLVESYAAARKQRVESNARDYVTVANFGHGVPAGWAIDGVGLRQGPVRSGDFAVSLEGPAAIQMLMPAGLFTNSLSTRLNGVLRTPFLNHSDAKNFSIQAAGGDLSTVSEIVDNAFMTERQVYLKILQPQWTGLFPVGGQSGDMPKTEDEKAEMRIGSEVATRASNPNFPPRIGLIQNVATLEQERDPHSWFGVTRVVKHSNDTPPADELARFESLLAGDVPVDLAAAGSRFQQWAQTAIDAWRQDGANEDHVWIVNWLIERNLLPNKMEEREPVRLLVNYYRAIEKQIDDPQTVNGMADMDPGRDYRLNIRGVYEDLGERVPRGYVKVLAGEGSGVVTRQSGRLELAQSVASPANPLTARVFVNRIWHWIFGTGIVATTDDFGHLGERPSHPELLDYLASEFMAGGWSIKKLVQRLALSETFRQSGDISPKALEVDPLNQLLSHYPLRRLEAESIRDSLLAVSSRLDRRLYGETIDPPRTKEDPDKRLFSGPLDGNGRRSIYIRMSIMEPPRFLATFNQPTPKVPRGRRDKTNSPAQALALLNDPFVASQAEFWAKTLIEQPQSDPQERLTVMFRRAFGRNPEAAEMARWTTIAHQLVEIHYDALAPSLPRSGIMKSLDVWKDLAHTMFNAKEFIYVR